MCWEPPVNAPVFGRTGSLYYMLGALLTKDFPPRMTNMFRLRVNLDNGIASDL